jgi:PhzF family phenazine biosynthesis protein
MNTLKKYHIDAFASEIFAGNPAAVCPLKEWLPDALMQNVAMENNLAETAFYVKEKVGYRIRWFTPTVEVDLCGHATLASAYVLFNYENYAGNIVTFNSRSGPLTVTKSGEMLTLDFPQDVFKEVSPLPELTESLAANPVKTFRGKTDYMLVFENEETIRKMKPDFKQLAKVNARGVIVTAKGKKVDFISRFFGPQSGGDEDPVTGSAHTTLTPYWSSMLGKTKLEAQQVSSRGGELQCELVDNRVLISGKAKLFSTGEIFL